VETNEPPVQTLPTFPNNYDELEDEDAIGVSNALAAYSISKMGKVDGLPCYDSSLGLAIETLPEGYTMTSLWEVISNNKNE